MIPTVTRITRLWHVSSSETLAETREDEELRPRDAAANKLALRATGIQPYCLFVPWKGCACLKVTVSQSADVQISGGGLARPLYLEPQTGAWIGEACVRYSFHDDIVMSRSESHLYRMG